MLALPAWTGFSKPSACLQASIKPPGLPQAERAFLPRDVRRGEGLLYCKERGNENSKCQMTEMSWLKKEGSEDFILCKYRNSTFSEMNRRVKFFSKSTLGYTLDLLSQELPEGEHFFDELQVDWLKGKEVLAHPSFKAIWFKVSSASPIYCRGHGSLPPPGGHTLKLQGLLLEAGGNPLAEWRKQMKWT